VKECPRCHACADDELEHCPADDVELQKGFPGSLLLAGKYQLERRLGQGGMGVVYLARHVDLTRSVAIEIITGTDAGFTDRFRIEAAALGQLTLVVIA
jgi:serine/threonine-protein kinase